MSTDNFGSAVRIRPGGESSGGSNSGNHGQQKEREDFARHFDGLICC